FNALKEGRLLGLRCLDCGQVTCPPFSVCQKCGSKRLERTTLSGKGKLMTFTVIHVPPEGYESPYVVCYIRLSEGPWIPGRLNINPEIAMKENINLLGKDVKLKGHIICPGDKHTSFMDRIIPLFEITTDNEL
ncbi:MAG: Zn-ribbon domain-containing OB-fold protein, partial [Candidatus Bathyarchaeia archaeon]